MTTASAHDQAQLLELQQADSSLDVIAHRLRNLPERAVLAAADSELVTLADRLVAADAEVSDLERAVRRAEAEVEAVKERARRDNELLISGSITAPKQLEELQHEVASLARRQDDLETAELEVMEQLDGAVANRAEISVRTDAVTRDRDAAATAIAEAEAHAAGEREQITAERNRLAASLPAELLALYERIRADSAGVGAARVHRGRCEGCHLDLPPSDVARIRAAADDEVLRCEECRRILIRTSESGL